MAVIGEICRIIFLLSKRCTGISGNGAMKGVYDLIVSKLREMQRKGLGKEQTLSVAVIDSQTVKNTSFSTKEVGVDVGKGVKGRKRHILTATLGNLLAAKVHPANVHDIKSTQLVLAKMIENNVEFTRLKNFFCTQRLYRKFV